MSMSSPAVAVEQRATALRHWRVVAGALRAVSEATIVATRREQPGLRTWARPEQPGLRTWALRSRVAHWTGDLESGGPRRGTRIGLGPAGV
jgi:hypothetical protein